MTNNQIILWVDQAGELHVVSFQTAEEAERFLDERELSGDLADFDWTTE